MNIFIHQKLPGHVLHTQQLGDPLTLAHKDIVNIQTAADKTFKIAAAFGEDQIRSIDLLLQLLWHRS